MEGTPKTQRGRSMWRSEDRVINAWRMVAVGWGAGVRGEAASERWKLIANGLEFPG